MLGRLIATRQSEERAGVLSYDTQWPGDVDPTWSGAKVSRDSALQLLAVYGCVRLITDTISTMPVDVFRKAGGAPQAAPMPRWLMQPTPHLSFKDWCGQRVRVGQQVGSDDDRVADPARPASRDGHT
jgi:hypothetical protein